MDHPIASARAPTGNGPDDRLAQIRVGASLSATSEVRPRFDSGDKLVAAALAAGSILPFLALGRTWWGSEHMSHGFLVPLVSIAVAAQRSARLVTLPSA